MYCNCPESECQSPFRTSVDELLDLAYIEKAEKRTGRRMGTKAFHEGCTIETCRHERRERSDAGPMWKRIRETYPATPPYTVH